MDGKLSNRSADLRLPGDSRLDRPVERQTPLADDLGRIQRHSGARLSSTGLKLDAGAASETGRRANNEDSCLLVTPSTGRYRDRGALLAVADGVGGFPDGEGASASAVAALHESYYAAPETWTLEHTLSESFDHANQAVLSGGAPGRATTLSALALHSHRWVVAHVGDTRVWRLRDGGISQITQDHHLPHAQFGALITRACGLDRQLHPDLYSGELSAGDVYLLTSDGVHQFLDETALVAELVRDAHAQDIADALVHHAYDAGSHDNVSACVVRVLDLPAETEADVRATLGDLPIGALPVEGELLDQYRIEQRLHAGRMSNLYLAVDEQNGARVVLKFPNPQHAEDAAFVEFFLREEWLGRRLDSPYLVKTLAVRPGRRTRLYSVMAYHSGETLAQRIRRRNGLAVREALRYTRALLTALDHLHRKGVIHRDVKPENILIDETDRLRLTDLGISRVERYHEPAQTAPGPAGTPSYMAPELFQAGEASERSDVYAAGVTLYEMLTQHFPNGEIEPFTRPRFRAPTAPERYNPDIPAWLSAVILKACSIDPKDRYADVVEFATALHPPVLASAAPASRRPLLERIPPGRWKLLFMISLVVNLALLAGRWLR